MQTLRSPKSPKLKRYPCQPTNKGLVHKIIQMITILEKNTQGAGPCHSYSNLDRTNVPWKSFHLLFVKDGPAQLSLFVRIRLVISEFIEVNQMSPG